LVTLWCRALGLKGSEHACSHGTTGFGAIDCIAWVEPWRLVTTERSPSLSRDRASEGLDQEGQGAVPGGVTPSRARPPSAVACLQDSPARPSRLGRSRIQSGAAPAHSPVTGLGRLLEGSVLPWTTANSRKTASPAGTGALSSDTVWGTRAIYLRRANGLPTLCVHQPSCLTSTNHLPSHLCRRRRRHAYDHNRHYKSQLKA
jgi:hypothetical protein